MIELFILILIIVIICIYLKSNLEKSKFKKINFKNKKMYLCVFFLYGNCNLKTNKAVLSRDKNNFLIETEDKDHNVESFGFSSDDVVNIEIKENLSSKSSEQLWNNFTTADHIGASGLKTTYTATKTTKFYKVYDIKIILKNDIKMHIQSTKSPYFIFD